MPFTKSGQALHGEIDGGIEAYRENRLHVGGADDLTPLLAEAEGWRDRSTPGTPMHRSSSACVAMVQAEQARRAS